MSAKKSKTFFKTLTAILVLLLFFGGYYIYSSGIFGASVTENISEHSITDEERLIEYEEYGITYDESSQSYALRVAIPLRFGKTSTPNFHSSQSSMTQLCFSSARKPGHHHHTLLFSLRSVPAFFKISTYLDSIETR